jgi:hypothetical protein
MRGSTTRFRCGLTAMLLLATLASGVHAIPQTAPLLPPPGSPVTASPSTADPEPPPPTLAPGDAVEVIVGDRRVRLRLETAAPETGLPLAFTVELLEADGRAIEATAVELPEPGDTIDDFEVVAIDPVRTTSNETTATSAPPRRWSIRTFGSGPVVLPAITVGLDGRTARTDARTIDVTSVAGLDTDPSLYRDIAGEVSVTAPGVGPLSWILGGLTAVALAIAAVWWWRRPRPEPPAEPADTWALGRINALLAERLVEQGRVQAFYFGLTDIVRAFIERRYQLAAPDRTTAEFIDEARRHPELGEDTARLLGNLLKSADMVKFAGDRPLAQDCDRAVDTIRRFVMNAGPRPEPREPLDPQSNPARGEHGTARRLAIADAVDGLDRLETRS